MNIPIDRPSMQTVPTLSFSVFPSRSVLSFSQKVVVRGCCHCCCQSCVLFFPLATADLLSWFAAIWRYTKSHYSVGHGLDKGEGGTWAGGWSKRDRIHLTLPGGEKRWRMQSEEVRFRGEVCSDAFDLRIFFCWHSRCRANAVGSCVCTRVRMLGSIWAPGFLSAPSGPAAQRERERETKREWVTQQMKESK